MSTCLHVFPTFGFGGVAIRIATIINGLGSSYRHVIVALDGRFEAAERLGDTAAYQLCRFETAPTLIQTVTRARAFVKDRKPDVLLTYNWGAIEWAFAHTIRPVCPHLHFESGFGVEEADRQIRRRVLFRRMALARSHRLVVPSHTLERLAVDLWKIDRRKVVVIPNGVDLDLFAADPATTGDRFRSRPDDVIIGTVAPLRPEKNLGRLLRVFARLGRTRPFRLVIAGDGPERAALETLAESLGIADRTLFLGHVHKVETVLPAFDIFALLSDTEQMPNSLIQAMAAGRPAVAADVGDVKRILAAENRPYVCDKENEAALVQAFATLAGDRPLRTTLGHLNRERACRVYGLARMIASYGVVLDEVLRTAHEHREPKGEVGREDPAGHRNKTGVIP